MSSQSNEHLLNLEYCQNRECKRGYLTIVLAAEKAGFETRAGAKGEVRELQIRQGPPQPFSMIVNRNSLLFYLRRPALADRPQLVEEARARFGTSIATAEDSLTEVRISLYSEADAEDVTDWLFPNPVYAARRSA